MSGWNKYVDTKPIMNKSYCYLFPMIGLSNHISRGNFINLKGVFLRNEDFPNEYDRLYLLFASGDRRFESFKNTLENADTYIHHYNPDRYHCIFTLGIPREYYREYDKFMDSRYSEFSDNYKRAIIAFHGYKKGSEGDRIIQIMYKDEGLYQKYEEELNTRIPRSQEIGSRWDENTDTINRETYTKDMKVNENILT